MKAEARARKGKQVAENVPKSPKQRQPKMKTTQTTAGESSVQAAALVREAAKRKRSPATTPPKPRKVRRVSEKDMDISLTVGVPGEDITEVTFEWVSSLWRGRTPTSSCIYKQMLASGQYMPGFKWLSMPHMSRLRAELLWKACVAHDK
ncbi:hypothetical protein R1sor_009678 [Riccia sorocarpa]|uniref:Uncharacterized protein n=1 Tax=Riccia sorocarpa TaxID=122646 RepID=A0ABD3HYK1_9MARC